MAFLCTDNSFQLNEFTNCGSFTIFQAIDSTGAERCVRPSPAFESVLPVPVFFFFSDLTGAKIADSLPACRYAHTLAGHEYVANENFEKGLMCYRACATAAQ